MKVYVEIRGAIAEDRAVADSFAEIAPECVTNAVRHGYATCIQFHFFQNDCWRMTVTDNGIPRSGRFVRAVVLAGCAEDSAAWRYIEALYCP